MPIGQAATWAKEKFIPTTVVLEKVKELLPILKKTSLLQPLTTNYPMGKVGLD